MRKYVANCAWLGLVFSVVMTVVTAILCRNILVWMKTPANIIDGAYDYIFIIFIGIPTVYLYNIVAGVIRATGDSKTPVVFLVLSSIINIVLDLYFIISLHMGVAGAAWATAVSYTHLDVYKRQAVIRSGQIRTLWEKAKSRS